ncbi:MAG: sugar transferase [Patescibacteria group bacterium]|nr:sugar transferase [Patescibacteria group bacterium]
MRPRNPILLLGDFVLMYTSLVVALVVRGGVDFMLSALFAHLAPFTLLFAVWSVVFYINDLYSRRRLRVDGNFIRVFLGSMLVNLAAAVAFFYLIGPSVGITPKTNLFLMTALFMVAFVVWRRVASSMFLNDLARKTVLFLEPDGIGDGLMEQIESDPSVPYVMKGAIRMEEGVEQALDAVPLGQAGVDIVVVGNTKYAELERFLYGITLRGSTVVDGASFWEELNGEIPVSEIDTAWLVNNFGDMHKRQYEALKRGRDAVSSFVLGTSLSWLMFLIAVAVRLTSRGPAFYRQVRVGRDGRKFVLVKFRTMVKDAEKSGPVWSEKGDLRVTPFGRILRHTHLDELPQLWNIMKGDMSFVGPRPERPEFVGELEKMVPYYSLRHLVRPGVSGWAQINYRYGASVDDATRKLAYDLYYIKHRNHLLDLKIGLKTAATVFRGEGR